MNPKQSETNVQGAFQEAWTTKTAIDQCLDRGLKPINPPGIRSSADIREAAKSAVIQISSSLELAIPFERKNIVSCYVPAKSALGEDLPEDVTRLHPDLRLLERYPRSDGLGIAGSVAKHAPSLRPDQRPARLEVTTPEAMRALLVWLTGASTSERGAVVEDIEDLNQHLELSPTVRKALIDARLGQGDFRRALILFWRKCPLSGIEEPRLLRASHIKPWRLSNNRERLDSFNGLLLAAHLDAAFDGGFLTFKDDGAIVVSSKLSKSDVDALGLAPGVRISLDVRHHAYLAHHRREAFKT